MAQPVHTKANRLRSGKVVVEWRQGRSFGAVVFTPQGRAHDAMQSTATTKRRFVELADLPNGVLDQATSARNTFLGASA